MNLKTGTLLRYYFHVSIIYIKYHPLVSPTAKVRYDVNVNNYDDVYSNNDDDDDTEEDRDDDKDSNAILSNNTLLRTTKMLLIHTSLYHV